MRPTLSSTLLSYSPLWINWSIPTGYYAISGTFLAMNTKKKSLKLMNATVLLLIA